LGARFRVFNEANTPALRNRLISCLFEDASGKLWFGSDAGEITWRDETGFHALAVTNDWPSSPIDRFAESADGTLWVLCQGGFLLSVRNLSVQGVVGEAAGPLYSDVVADTQGQVWAVRFGGTLYCYLIRMHDGPGSSYTDWETFSVSGGDLYIGSSGVYDAGGGGTHHTTITLSGGTFHTVNLGANTGGTQGTNSILTGGTDWTWSSTLPARTAPRSG